MGWGFEGARLIKTGENTMLTVFIKEKSMNRIVLLAVCKHIGIDPIAIKNNKNILIFCVEVSMHNKRKIYFQFIRYDFFFLLINIHYYISELKATVILKETKKKLIINVSPSLT